MKKIAIIGTNGVPSKYGGFETLVEYLVTYLSKKYDITVFCSAAISTEKLSTYKGANLSYISLNANGWQSILFDIISLFKSCRKYDKVLILGSSGCIILPLFNSFRHKFVFNFGGLDWKRSKWGFFTRGFLKFSESLGIRYSDYLISDNVGIQDYITNEYNRTSTLITYGGDQAVKVLPSAQAINKYPFLIKDYVFTVTRIQHDNNVEMLLNAFDQDSPMPFVFVGNWSKSTYGLNTKEKYINKPNIILLDAIYDQNELNILRSNCKLYLHGHSAGGTNPALVEAMNLGLPILTHNSIFNKHTTHFKADYFSDSEELSAKINTLSDSDLKSLGQKMYKIGKEMYQWKKIAEQYAEVFDM